MTDKITNSDPELIFIGRIRTPWASPSECPRNTMESEAVCRVELEPAFRAGLASLDTCSHAILLYWLDQARRDLLKITPPHDDRTHGVFALRAPSRPNPIGLAVVDVLNVDGEGLDVRHIDCVDGTPLLDIKPYFASTDSKPDATVGWHTHRSKPLPPRGG